jgi:hypothetical protein
MRIKIMSKADSHDTTTNVVKFPDSVSRHARRSRTSKNGTPEQRAAKAAADAAKAVARKNPDPAFTLIAEKLAADVAHCAAIDADCEFERHDDFTSDAAIEAHDNSVDACDYANEVEWKLATTPPTTLAGVAAVLRFANEIEDANMEWPATDAIGPDGWHYQLRATMAAAIEALIKGPPAGKAVQS